MYNVEGAFGREMDSLKIDDDVNGDTKVELGWTDVDADTSWACDRPLLRQFICRFTETRVRSELSGRCRTLSRDRSARIKVPSYRGLHDGVIHTDVCRPLGSGRIEKILKSIIVQTISEKLCPPIRRSPWRFDTDDRRTGLPLSAPVTDVMDSRSSSSDDAVSQAALAEDADIQQVPVGRKTRPKRGHYRKYNRQLLLDAVRAVQKGDMSVHRAGSYYGVPHSTLEYKVKERHLLRQRKTETACSSGRRRRGNTEDHYHQRSSAAEVESRPRSRMESAEEYLARLGVGSNWRPLSDHPTDDSIPSWTGLFHPDPANLSGRPALQLPPPPPPLLPYDLGRTLPVGFGWPPPPPPLLTGLFDGSPPWMNGSPPRVDSHRLPIAPPPVAAAPAYSFSMSASDLLKSFQQKAVASGGGESSDVREMADDRLLSLFPVLGGGHYGRGQDGGSPSQVAVG